MIPPPKKNYDPPQLTVYGRVEELTQTGCYEEKTVSSSADDFWVNSLLDDWGSPVFIGDCDYS